jgi:hypothetical protein
MTDSLSWRCFLILQLTPVPSKPDQALCCLEEGRTIILSQLMDDRSNISKLHSQYPDLALLKSKVIE